MFGALIRGLGYSALGLIYHRNIGFLSYYHRLLVAFASTYAFKI